MPILRRLSIILAVLCLFCTPVFATITYVSQFGSAGSGNGQFNSPYSISFDSSGNIYVTDNGNHRIQKFDSNGTYISQFGSE